MPGTAVHVVHRGNNRAQCFFSDEDRAFYVFHLARTLGRSGCRLHAYCLMDNHVHLLLTPEQANGCALLMKSVAQLYARYFNKRYRRTGYLWEGRFKSCLVQSEHYALACYRYIEMNPIRAGMVRAPAEFPWSSFRVNAHGEPSSLITPHLQYEQLGATAAERQAAYRDLFGMAGIAVDDIRRATNGGFVLGDAAFRKQVTTLVGRRVEAGTPGRKATQRADDVSGQQLLLETGVRP